MEQASEDQSAGHDWAGYYQSLKGREPRPVFREVLAKYDAASSNPGASRTAALQAVDLGCGDGTETLALLAAGWSVLAVDQEPAAIEHVLIKAAALPDAELKTMVSAFEDLQLPETELVYAGYSLPFCIPAHFNALWGKITDCIRPGGRFAGQLFGIRDSWAEEREMTFHSADQVEALLVHSFEIEMLEEIDEEGEAFSGPKHWHLFDIIARKIELP